MICASTQIKCSKLYMEQNKFQIGISLTCFKRADYLSQVLDSLKKSLEFSSYRDSFRLYPSIDFKNNSVVDLIKNIDWIDTNFIINNPPIGCNRNTKQAVQRAIQDNDAVLHIEDDTVLSYDALDFFVYALDKYKDDPQVLSLSGYTKTESINEEQYYATICEQFFCCWGCCFWKSKIDTILNNWTNQLDFMNPQSWDTHIQETLFKNRYYQVRPVVSRIQNIGAKNGTYVHDPVWHYYNHRSPYTSNDMKHTQYNSWMEYAKNN